MTEAVNHPSHYGGGDNPYEVIKVIRAWEMGFSLGNAVKYVARAGKKGGPHKAIEDLRKAIWYIKEEIAHLENREDEEGQEQLVDIDSVRQDHEVGGRPGWIETERQ